jgi:septum formation protein
VTDGRPDATPVTGPTGPRLVLASSSPRRRELLGRLGVAFTIRVPDIDETPRDREAPTRYVERLARGKAHAGQALATDAALDEVVVAADTTVDVDGDIIGKPVGRADAMSMLGRLSGRDHLVHTGVAVARGGQLVSSVTTSTVTFALLDQDEIEDYVATEQPYDKAGAYSIQGPAGTFVTAIDGSASNVLGLPMAQTEALLARVGFAPVMWGPPRPEPGAPSSGPG